MMMTDDHSLMVMPSTNQSVSTTITIDIAKLMSHRLSMRIGSVMMRSIPPMTRLTSQRMKVNIRSEFVQSSRDIPGRY